MLTNRTLLFRCPTEFNDPFDSQWDPFWQMRTSEYQSIERDLLRRALIDPHSWTTEADPEHQIAIFEHRMNVWAQPRSFRERAINRLLDEFRRDPDEAICDEALDLQRRLRIHSFTESFDSLLMWSHYGEDHKGLVFGFDTEILENHFLTGIEPVTYSESLPPMLDMYALAHNLIYGTNLDAFASDEERKIALYKHEGWSYEKEWRIVWVNIDKSQAELLTEIPKESIRSITMGCKCSEIDATEITELAAQNFPDAEVYRTQPHRFQFKIERLD